MTSTSPTSRAKSRPSLYLLAGVAFLSSLSDLASQSASADSLPTEDRAREVVFMGYNVKNYLRMPRQVNGTRVAAVPKPEAEIEAVVALILQGRPDILGLVEMGSQADLKDLQARLKRSGLDLPHATLNEAFDQDRRTALLSHFPFASVQHQTDLHYQAGTERLAFRRGILDATIALSPDYELRVLGVHFKSKRPQPGLLNEALMRRHEAHLTRQHLVSILESAPETNLLLFGDLNDSRHEAPINAVRGTRGTPGYMEPLRVADPNGARWTYYWEVADQYSRFDYLFVSQGLRPEILTKKQGIVSHPGWATASDHRPVVTTLIAEDRD